MNEAVSYKCASKYCFTLLRLHRLLIINVSIATLLIENANCLRVKFGNSCYIIVSVLYYTPFVIDVTRNILYSLLID